MQRHVHYSKVPVLNLQSIYKDNVLVLNLQSIYKDRYYKVQASYLMGGLFIRPYLDLNGRLFTSDGTTGTSATGTSAG